MNDKPAYEAPAIVDHGDLTDLTAAAAQTGNFDANFPANTPIPPAFGSQP